MKISRNSPCPCGSGKKHKNCCLKEGGNDAEPISMDKVQPPINLKMLHTLAVFTALQAFPENTNWLIALQEMSFDRLTSKAYNDDQFAYQKLHTTFFNHQW